MYGASFWPGSVMRESGARVKLNEHGYLPRHSSGALIVADVSGTFHPFWHEKGPIGGELWTRSVSLGIPPAAGPAGPGGVDGA